VERRKAGSDPANGIGFCGAAVWASHFLSTHVFHSLGRNP